MEVNLSLSREQRQFMYYVLEDTNVQTVAYGGARFGGKTFCNCLAAVLFCLRHPRMRVLMLRRVMQSTKANLGDEIDHIHELLHIPKKAVRYTDTKSQYWYPNGSMIQLGYCRLDKDWEIYKGNQYHAIFWEEATQFWESQYQGLRGSCRSATPGVAAKKVLTTNPDGVGVTWVRRRFIRPETREPGSVFIQSRVRDCLPTLEKDPGYVLRELRNLPEWQRQQWEEGNWDSVEGAYWALTPECFGNYQYPEWAEIYCGVDAGFWPGAFACVWAAKWRDWETGQERLHLFKDLKRHRLNLHECADAALDVEDGFDRPVRTRYADPACWTRRETDEGLSTTTAHVWTRDGFRVTAASTNQRVTGWQVQRALMSDLVWTCDPDGCPNLYEEMVGSVREKDGEDIDPRCEDHAQDAQRYMTISIFGGGYRRRGEEVRSGRGSRRAQRMRDAVAGGRLITLPPS